MVDGSNFPITLDTFTTKVAGLDYVKVVETNTQSSAIEKLQAKVGVDGSAITSSLDYKVTNSVLSVGKAGGQTISGGTANTEGLSLNNNSVSNKGLVVMPSGIIAVNTTSYETLIAGDNDIPNKKYVDSMSGGGISGGGINWTEIITTSVNMTENTGYIVNNNSLVSLTLPLTCAVGKTLKIAGKGNGGWKILQNTMQVIHFGFFDTAIGTTGYLQNQHKYDSIELLCVTADLEFLVLNSFGNIIVN